MEQDGAAREGVTTLSHLTIELIHMWSSHTNYNLTMFIHTVFHDFCGEIDLKLLGNKQILVINSFSNADVHIFYISIFIACTFILYCDKVFILKYFLNFYSCS